MPVSLLGCNLRSVNDTNAWIFDEMDLGRALNDRINICNDFHANSDGYRTPNMVMREEKNREGCQCSNTRWESTRKRDNREASAFLWFQRAYHIGNGTPYFCL